MNKIDLRESNLKHIKIYDTSLKRYITNKFINSSLINMIDTIVIIESKVELYKFLKLERSIVYKYKDKVDSYKIIIMIVKNKDEFIAVIFNEEYLD